MRMQYEMNEYQVNAQRTASTNTAEDKIINGCFGLAGECGEVCDVVKKYLYQGHPLDREKLVEELGDVLWYCAELAEGLGIELADVARQNIAKLYERYPDGFEVVRSRERPHEPISEDFRCGVKEITGERVRGVHGARRRRGGRKRNVGSPKGFLEAEAVGPEIHEE